jgi:ATP-binding cassette subfamily B protein
MRGVCADALRLMALSWGQDRRRTAWAVALMLAGASAAPLMALCVRGLIEGTAGGDAVPASLAAIAVALLAIASLVLGHFAHIAYFELADLNLLRINERLISLSNGSVSVGHHERPGFADRLSLVEREVQQVRTALQSVLTLAGLGLAMVVTVTLLALLHPVLLLLPLLALPPLMAERWADRITDTARQDTAENTRVAHNLYRLATEAAPAKELRLLRLQRTLMDRHAALSEQVTARLWRARLRATLLTTCGQLVFAAGYLSAVLLIVHGAVAQQRGVGDVVLAVVLAVQVNQQVAGAVPLFQNLQRMSGAFRQMARIEEEVAPAGRPARRRPPPRLTSGIELSDVAFEYGTGGVPVLRDVSLRLPAGSSVAVVGENGAGKSTLAKVLCGLQRPTRGTVTVDGEDLSAMAPEAWRDRVAVCFQDFVHWEFLARETVGVGDLPRIDGDDAVRGALQRAGAQDLVRGLPLGPETPLGRTHHDGVELSGGQWQKLALGRALMREEPLLLVLDEPASALDPAAEHALFERYAEQARRMARRTGAVTVFVSHRFSTVRMADLIVVMVDGRVQELGDHAALMANEGVYAELYGLHIDAYS